MSRDETTGGGNMPHLIKLGKYDVELFKNREEENNEFMVEGLLFRELF